jgi:hypothetical protein
MVSSSSLSPCATSTLVPPARSPSLLLSTVSIPASLLYTPLTIPPTDADIVCARAKHHFDPEASGDVDLNFSESGDQQSRAGSDTSGLQRYKDLFKPLHSQAAMRMYCECTSGYVSRLRLMGDVFSLLIDRCAPMRLPRMCPNVVIRDLCFYML